MCKIAQWGHFFVVKIAHHIRRARRRERLRADVLADPRARTPRRRGSAVAVERTFYRLADEPREVILVACSKCEWKAAFRRDELIALHGSDYPMPSLLDKLAAPGCAKVGLQWDRCGAHYVEPIGGQAS